MKAIQIYRTGGPEVLTYSEISPPTPTPTQVKVKLCYSGVNFIDTYHRTGLYPVELPAILGLEGAGVVTEIGESVTQFSIGQKVAFPKSQNAYAEVVCVEESKLVPVPESFELDVACALMIQGMTAHYLAVDTYSLEPGKSCLVHAAAGGVGSLLVQIAKQRGAYVIGTVSTEAKADKVKKLGIDEVILYTENDFEAQVRNLTNGNGVNVVYDSVGRDTFEKSLRCLSPRGMLVLFGQSSGAIGSFDPLLLHRHGSLYVTRPKLDDYIQNQQELLSRAGEIFNWTLEGRLKIEIGETFNLAEAEQAHRALEARATTGKLLLRC